MDEYQFRETGVSIKEQLEDEEAGYKKVKSNVFFTLQSLLDPDRE